MEQNDLEIPNVFDGDSDGRCQFKPEHAEFQKSF